MKCCDAAAPVTCLPAAGRQMYADMFELSSAQKQERLADERCAGMAAEHTALEARVLQLEVRCIEATLHNARQTIDGRRAHFRGISASLAAEVLNAAGLLDLTSCSQPPNVS